jgi:glycosyltransferase involved in cell wall biosynthesis
MNNIPKKVVIVGPAFPFRGGLAAYNERLAKAFIEAGYSVHILTFTLQYPNILFPGKTQYATWDAPTDLHITQSLSSINPFSWRSTAKKIQKLSADLVVFKFWLPFMGPAFGSVAKLTKKYLPNTPIVCILDNVIPHEKRIGDTILTRYFIKHVDAFIGMSRSVLNDLALFNKNKARRFSPHPIFDNFGKKKTKEDACQQLGLDPKLNYLLFFGIIRDYKGLDWLIEAYKASSVDKKNIKLLVAGEFYTDAKPYKELIKKHGLTDSIILHEKFIPDEEVANYFCAADMIVQPYKHATQSGVTQIGYHFEKPMLVTNVGGLGEIIPDKVGGYVVEPNIEAISQALGDFYENDRLCGYTEGIIEAKQRFTWDKMIGQIELLLKDLKDETN